MLAPRHGAELTQQTSVLIVEDSELFRRFLRLLLATPDIRIVGEAANGTDALEIARGFAPELVLLDIHLPDVNGIEVGRRIRQILPEAKLVFVTQETSEDFIQEALSVGTGYVSKNCAGADLPAAIAHVLKDRTFVSPDLDGRGSPKSWGSAL